MASRVVTLGGLCVDWVLPQEQTHTCYWRVQSLEATALSSTPGMATLQSCIWGSAREDWGAEPVLFQLLLMQVPPTAPGGCTGLEGQIARTSEPFVPSGQLCPGEQGWDDSTFCPCGLQVEDIWGQDGMNTLAVLWAPGGERHLGLHL